ncbi:Major facilitator superfamily domain-containing protein 1 [Durusdinium trenchii]|uniref:Lysosomal dipeptide transporter MFSD1 n=1 Tax=Durusdinium trenchii TaxID=1381693 RepID=A0ABP0L6E3_9DINO
MMTADRINGWLVAILTLGIVVLSFSACCSRHVAKYFVDPRRGLHKYILLTLICLFIPGPYFHDGLLQSFKLSICDTMQLSNAEFASLFVVSSFTGSSVTTLGFVWKSLAAMWLGRLLFWLGLNVLLMVQTILVYDLFKGRGLSCAMTTIVCSIRLGGSMSYPLSGPMLHQIGVVNSLWFSVALVVGAFISTLLFGYLFRGTATARAVRPMLERRAPPSSIEFALVRQIHKIVIVFLSGIAAIWGVVFPFEVIGDDMLQREFGYSADNAGFIIAAAPMVSILSPALVPFLGSTLHQKLRAFRLGLLTLMLAFLMIGAFQLAIFGVVLVGCGYAVAVSASYSCLPLVIAASAPQDTKNHKKFEKLAVGLNMAGSGFSMIVSNLTIGVIKDNASYRWACLFLACVAACGVVSVSWVRCRCPEPCIPSEPSREMEEPNLCQSNQFKQILNIERLMGFPLCRGPGRGRG